MKNAACNYAIVCIAINENPALEREQFTRLFYKTGEGQNIKL